MIQRVIIWDLLPVSFYCVVAVTLHSLSSWVYLKFWLVFFVMRAKKSNLDSLSALFFLRHKFMKSKSSHQVPDNLRIICGCYLWLKIFSTNRIKSRDVIWGSNVIWIISKCVQSSIFVNHSKVLNKVLYYLKNPPRAIGWHQLISCIISLNGVTVILS